MQDFAIAVAIGVPLATLIIGVMTFVLVQTKADGRALERLEDKVVRLEGELQNCNQEASRLTRENIELMRRLASP